jgi:hypothetical protein
LINFGLLGLFGLSDLEKSKPNQRTKTELAKFSTKLKFLNRKYEPNSPKFNGSVQNQLNRSVCTPLHGTTFLCTYIMYSLDGFIVTIRITDTIEKLAQAILIK